ncbi:unnamed protein product, partial [Ectocarpus sp. 12 AP-2014]
NKSLTPLPTTLLPGLENTSSSTSHYRMPPETADEERPRTGEAVVLKVSDFVQIVDNGCLAPGRPMFGLNTNAFRPVTAQHIAREIVDRNGLSTSTTAVALTPPREDWRTPEGWLDAVENALKKTKDGEGKADISRRIETVRSSQSKISWDAALNASTWDIEHGQVEHEFEDHRPHMVTTQRQHRFAVLNAATNRATGPVAFTRRRPWGTRGLPRRKRSVLA